MSRKRNGVAFVAGLLFAIGLAISGMTRPSKVLGFLDVTGDCDPSLLFVMGGALAVHMVAVRFILRRPRPHFAHRFHVPGRNAIDAKLLLGAGLFGVGWGLAGYCPGPAIVSSASLGLAPVVFVASMIAGMALFEALGARQPSKQAEHPGAEMKALTGSE